MSYIKSITLKNFKRFSEFSVEFDPEVNLLIGDNEAGKSSILLAIDLVLSGSRSKVDSVGLEGLFNSDAVNQFLTGGKKYNDLPVLQVELYLCEQNNISTHGKFNSLTQNCDGLLMEFLPNNELSLEIRDILKQDDANFPFEFYTVNFKTFSGNSFSSYSKFLKHIFIDHSQINNEYAMREYIKSIYHINAVGAEKKSHQNEYRKHKETFKTTVLAPLNNRINNYAFAIKTSNKANLETDLTITEDNISIDNKGKGKQSFIKTEFALARGSEKADLVLLEEPENHLSHLNMKRLISRIKDAKQTQLFITTHNTLVSTRLNLKKSILINSSSIVPLLLKELSDDTAKFFMKAPDNNIVEFILSKKVILVEGDAEFILMEAFYKKETLEDLERSNLHVISVGGTSFKRYLELALILKIKTAVIRDNDGDYQKKCVDNYKTFCNDHINVFAESDNSKYTFEVNFYDQNTAACDALFKSARKSLTVQEYMLQNKPDVAFEFLDKQASSIVTPNYIKEAIEWIRK
jgi:putative ATP-dependent endonuclease of OLD family